MQIRQFQEVREVVQQEERCIITLQTIQQQAHQHLVQVMEIGQQHSQQRKERMQQHITYGIIVM